MNRHDVTLLQQIRGYPCVTITLPTHRTSPENKQDPIRVTNLARQAADRLLDEFGKRELEPLLLRLEQLTKDVDYQHLLDGLALFVNRDFARAVQLPFTLKERVVVDETFFTRDLVFALNRTPRYWTLALSEKPTRLYEGLGENMVEIREGGFPMIHEGPGGEKPLPRDFGARTSAHRDEHHQQFFRRVDDAFKPFLADDPLPLVVVGVDRFLSFFNEVTNYRASILATLAGSHDRTAAHDLAKLVWPLVQAGLTEQRQQVLGELEMAVRDGKSVSTVGEVWRLAREGRGRLLLVEEDFHYPARMDELGSRLTPADDVTAPDVIDDAVDEIVESVLSKQGQVVFVDNGQLAKYQRIALILRY